VLTCQSSVLLDRVAICESPHLIVTMMPTKYFSKYWKAILAIVIIALIALLTAFLHDCNSAVSYKFLQDREDVLVFHEGESIKGNSVTTQTRTFPGDFNTVCDAANKELLPMGYGILTEPSFTGTRSHCLLFSGTIKEGTIKVKIISGRQASLQKQPRRVIGRIREGWITISVTSIHPKPQWVKFLEKLRASMNRST